MGLHLALKYLKMPKRQHRLTDSFCEAMYFALKKQLILANYTILQDTPFSQTLLEETRTSENTLLFFFFT